MRSTVLWGGSRRRMERMERMAQGEPEGLMVHQGRELTGYDAYHFPLFLASRVLSIGQHIFLISFLQN